MHCAAVYNLQIRYDTFPGIENYNGYTCSRNYKAAIKTALAPPPPLSLPPPNRKNKKQYHV